MQKYAKWLLVVVLVPVPIRADGLFSANPGLGLGIVSPATIEGMSVTLNDATPTLTVKASIAPTPTPQTNPPLCALPESVVDQVIAQSTLAAAPPAPVLVAVTEISGAATVREQIPSQCQTNPATQEVECQPVEFNINASDERSQLFVVDPDPDNLKLHPIEITVRDCATGALSTRIAGSEPLVVPISGGAPQPFNVDREVTVDRLRLVIGSGHGASVPSEKPSAEALSMDKSKKTMAGIDTTVASCLKIALIIDGSDRQGGFLGRMTISARKMYNASKLLADHLRNTGWEVLFFSQHWAKDTDYFTFSKDLDEQLRDILDRIRDAQEARNAKIEPGAFDIRPDMSEYCAHQVFVSTVGHGSKNGYFFLNKANGADENKGLRLKDMVMRLKYWLTRNTALYWLHSSCYSGVLIDEANPLVFGDQRNLDGMYIMTPTNATEQYKLKITDDEAQEDLVDGLTSDTDRDEDGAIYDDIDDGYLKMKSDSPFHNPQRLQRTSKRVQDAGMPAKNVLTFMKNE